MREPTKLQKQQVGLRLPRYLVDELDDFTRQYDLNRSELITEAIRAYIEEQKAQRFYREFDMAARELKAHLQGENKVQSLEALIHELEDH
ncbi:ribbon-helix-helix domain-containing protein [Desulfonatronum thiodismutans]|uniref:ribbon-helix-helix domain-containing protein n=1 Tax=Desulfonatronum thiodismutans TaxID=159290 RepID=UPI0004ABDBB9|nr:ribbon-helix-helix domain-containing protein [Desulfonatronum thiodismutans]